MEERERKERERIIAREKKEKQLSISVVQKVKKAYHAFSSGSTDLQPGFEALRFFFVLFFFVFFCFFLQIQFFFHLNS